MTSFSVEASADASTSPDVVDVLEVDVNGFAKTVTATDASTVPISLSATGTSSLTAFLDRTKAGLLRGVDMSGSAEASTAGVPPEQKNAAVGFGNDIGNVYFDVSVATSFVLTVNTSGTSAPVNAALSGFGNVVLERVSPQVILYRALDGPGGPARIEGVLQPGSYHLQGNAGAQAGEDATAPATGTFSLVLLLATGCDDPGAIVGTPGDDPHLDGTEGDDVICGLDGNDVIDGKGGNDVIWGGPGKDVIEGGPGNDVIHGDSGADVICGDVFKGKPNVKVGKKPVKCGGDTGSGATFADVIFGDDGNDTIGGGPGNDVIHGGSGNDKIQGGPGKDTIDGDAGDDRVAGGPDDDKVTGGLGADTILGEANDDKLFAIDGTADTLIDGGTETDTAKTDDPADANVVGVETVAH
ncbi:hypothetical protein K2Z84_31060 [Candidatus Binatia bacterium]|nr:hypothetical protein [Candidatus Binatia bacterium]